MFKHFFFTKCDFVKIYTFKNHSVDSFKQCFLVLFFLLSLDISNLCSEEWAFYKKIKKKISSKNITLKLHLLFFFLN